MSDICGTFSFGFEVILFNLGTVRNEQEHSLSLAFVIISCLYIVCKTVIVKSFVNIFQKLICVDCENKSLLISVLVGSAWPGQQQ